MKITYLVGEFQLFRRKVSGRIKDCIFGIFRQNAVEMIITAKSHDLLMMIINAAQLERKEQASSKLSSLKTSRIVWQRVDFNLQRQLSNDVEQDEGPS